MKPDTFMRLVVKQLKDTNRFKSVEGRVISGIICIDVEDLDGQNFTNTTFCLGEKKRIAPPYTGDLRPPSRPTQSSKSNPKS
jgi:hypothetical protein